MSSDDPKAPSYIHGHSPSVIRAHSARTAENSCAYLLPHLTSSMRILDIGCGPGTITCDLASRVPQGHVTGIDSTDSVLEQARACANERHLDNVTFAVGDIYALDFPEASFDVVHVHQVLQHLGDPVQALKEMRRVAKPGGLVGAREADIAASVWYPPSAGLDTWCDMYLKVAKWTGGTPDTGRRLKELARLAGFEVGGLTVGASTWCFSSPEEKAFWCGTWKERVRGSGFRGKAIESGIAGQEDLERLAEAWDAFEWEEDGWFVVVHGEVLYRV